MKLTDMEKCVVIIYALACVVLLLIYKQTTEQKQEIQIIPLQFKDGVAKKTTTKPKVVKHKR